MAAALLPFSPVDDHRRHQRPGDIRHGYIGGELCARTGTTVTLPSITLCVPVADRFAGTTFPPSA